MKNAAIRSGTAGMLGLTEILQRENQRIRILVSSTAPASAMNSRVRDNA